MQNFSLFEVFSTDFLHIFALRISQSKLFLVGDVFIMIPSFLFFFGGFGVFISDELFLFFLVLPGIGF